MFSRTKDYQARILDLSTNTQLEYSDFNEEYSKLIWEITTQIYKGRFLALDDKKRIRQTTNRLRGASCYGILELMELDDDEI